jgi:phosphorylase superfamily protein
MTADRQWLDANLGAKKSTLSLAPESATPSSPEGLARDRIEFDASSPAGAALLERREEPSPDLDKFVEIPWPAGLEPKPAHSAPEGESLPKADVLIVTWTTEEGRALSRVLTPGYESHTPGDPSKEEPGVTYWKRYVKNFDEIAKHMKPDCPARDYHRLGTYWTTEIGGKSVVLFKSDSHMSQDSAERTPEQTPNRLVWKQIIEDCDPTWVITTGTGGGIGAAREVGDVIVSRFVTFDPKGDDPQLEPFSCASDAPESKFGELSALIEPNAKFLPKTNKRKPDVIHAKQDTEGVLTTQGFAYDDTDDSYHLQGKGDVCEMGDAVLGYVCKEMGDAAPSYVMVRNASDPQVDSSLPDPGKVANEIYANFGRWSSVCSAVVCWGIVTSLGSGPCRPRLVLR